MTANRYYIGEDDCAKATCNKKQEFPKSDSCDYCLGHSWAEWEAESA